MRPELEHGAAGGALRTRLKRNPLQLGRLARWMAARFWMATGRGEENRREYFGGASGLRIVAFHETPPRQLDELRRLVEWTQERFTMAEPADVDALVAGRWSSGGDRVLFTCDDGMATNHAAAELLSRLGVKAIFFVIPSLVDRTLGEFADFHAQRGVRARPPPGGPGARGLSTSQVREMIDMGHLIAGHNYAHRDLGEIHDEPSLEYEIGLTLDAVAEITGKPCQDFAIGYGQPENVSPAAASFLLARVPKVYACHRGLNVVGRTSRFLLRHSLEPGQPLAFARAALTGAADHLLIERAREMSRRVGTLPEQRQEAAA